MMKKFALMALLIIAFAAFAPFASAATASVGSACTITLANSNPCGGGCAQMYCAKQTGDLTCGVGETGCTCQPSPSYWYKPCQAQLESSWNNWVPVASLAVFVAILLAAVAYMIGFGFDLRELKMWAKSEIYQAIASAIIVAGLLVLTQTMFDEGFSKIIGIHTNPYDKAFSYLNRLSLNLETLWDKNYQDNFNLEALSSFSIFFNATGLDLQILAPLKPYFIEPRHLVNHLILQILILIYFQQAMLVFFQRTMLTILLPIGVFMRVLPPTRGAGGLMIAMAIGFFFVFPTLFSFMAMMAEEQGDLEALLQSPSAASGIDLATFNACTQDIEEAARVGEQQLDPAVISKVNEFAATLPDITVKAIFFPMVIFAMTLTFIRMLSPILGSDVSEIGQGLIKLI